MQLPAIYAISASEYYYDLKYMVYDQKKLFSNHNRKEGQKELTFISIR